jgi:Putative S-adenosyl-L-methionine-dependent methyltransferase
VGCGVASFGGYLFDKDVLTMSFAPKDEHEAQVQFALERGIPAISAVMGTKRLPFPSAVFDAIHCARCRVPWHIEGHFLYFLFISIAFLYCDTCTTKFLFPIYVGLMHSGSFLYFSLFFFKRAFIFC